MPTPSQIVRQINGLIAWLVDQGLADDQCFAHQKSGPRGLVSVTFENAGYAGSARRNRPYDEIYQGFVQDRAFNAKMLDGALIQMTYGFASGVLQHHRLAFFAAPHLDEFQNNPEIYENDEVYANVVARNVVPVAVRFDYDGSDAMDHEIDHPKSHLTLGQYRNCRIPVVAPVTPHSFIDFILRNFYSVAFARNAGGFPAEEEPFDESIRPAERDVVHVVVPAA